MSPVYSTDKMDVSLICIDVWPSTFWEADIDRICGVVSTAIKSHRGSGTEDPNSLTAPRMVVSKTYRRRTVSRFYILASHPRDLDLPPLITGDEALKKVPPHALCFWAIDTARYQAHFRCSIDEAIYELFLKFEFKPIDEHVTCYFPADMTVEQKDKFEQVVHDSLLESYDADSSDDDMCSVQHIVGAHGDQNVATESATVIGQWGVWSRDVHDYPMQLANPGDDVSLKPRPALMYSLWICWANDEARFRFTHGGLRNKDLPYLEGINVPDGANFWYAMENFGGCYGRESRRLIWEVVNTEKVESVPS